MPRLHSLLSCADHDFIRILTNVDHRLGWVLYMGCEMTDLDDEEELSQIVPPQRWRLIANAAARFAPPAISIGCAMLAGHFAYVATNAKPPANISRLAISILKSGDASPEMRTWATDALGISTDIPMTVGSIKPISQ
jgi:hypothetical protein